MKPASVGTCVLLVLGLCAAVLDSAGAAQATSSIGYVSGQRLLAETSEGKAEMARLQQVQQGRLAELRTKQQAIETTRLQLASASQADRVKLQQQEQVQQAELQRATAQAQLDFQNMQRQSNANFQTKLRPVLEDLAKTHNLQVILNADSAVMWGMASLDLTQLVIDRLNKAAEAK